MLEAWHRMTAQPEDLSSGPAAYDYPELLGCLFILQGGQTDRLPFRIAGEDLSNILGQNLIGADFLELWAPEDRSLLAALVEKVLTENRPGLIHGEGHAGGNKTVGIEVVLAPLNKTDTGRNRILALYQILGSEAGAKTGAIRLHKLTALFPPEPERRQAKLRLVACND